MNWKAIIPYALFGICAVVLIVVLFKPKQREDKYLKMVLNLKDSLISQERSYRISEAAKYEQDRSEWLQRDSVYREKSNTNTIRYERVPVNVRNLSHDELRGAVNERYSMLPD